MITNFTFDDREHNLQTAFTKRIQGRTDLHMECKRLNMGDVIIEKEGGPLIIIERKQVNDLMCSLFDGRLAEQCSRMRQWQAEQASGDIWVVVIVEGIANVDQFRNAADPDSKFRHTQNDTH
jgi:ERCC4-type nuclease